MFVVLELVKVRIVVPGELVGEAKNVPSTYVEGGKARATVVGLFDELEGRLVSLQGTYNPRFDDVVIGVVEEVKFAGYTVDVNCAYRGFMSSRDCRKPLRLGDVIAAKVSSVDEVKNVNLIEPFVLFGGCIIDITPTKVPRLIGKKNSMIGMIVEATKSEVRVGKNGRVWIRGGNTSLAARAVFKIEAEAHVSGLTDRVQAFLKKEAENGSVAGIAEISEKKDVEGTRQ